MWIHSSSDKIATTFLPLITSASSVCSFALGNRPYVSKVIGKNSKRNIILGSKPAKNKNSACLMTKPKVVTLSLLGFGLFDLNHVWYIHTIYRYVCVYICSDTYNAEMTLYMFKFIFFVLISTVLFFKWWGELLKLYPSWTKHSHEHFSPSSSSSFPNYRHISFLLCFVLLHFTDIVLSTNQRFVATLSPASLLVPFSQ